MRALLKGRCSLRMSPKKILRKKILTVISEMTFWTALICSKRSQELIVVMTITKRSTGHSNNHRRNWPPMLTNRCSTNI